MHHARASKSQWQSRRNMSLGPPVRRAHPASGATWNVQVVRGKMTSRCLWHACRALILGMVLMFLGAGMATIGYYAEHLSVGQEIRGNATVRVKNESRGFHLNNLSYVGPIVMGFGGFIVVAACVMTFEARDSAAKVVPARFKVSTTSRTPRTNSTSRRTTGTSTQTAPQQQTSRWDARLGVFRTLPATTAGMAAAAAAHLVTDAGGSNASERKALTAALVHFSRALGKPRSPKLDTPPKSPPDPSRRFSRSDSVPNINSHLLPSPRSADASSGTSGTSTIQHQSTMTGTDRSPPLPVRYQKAMAGSRHRCHRKSSMLQRSSLSGERSTTSPVYLHPGSGAPGGGGGGRHQHWRQRHAMTVDESGPYYRSGQRSEEAFELGVLHTTLTSGHGGPMQAGGVSGTCRLRDRNQRSDTARRHVLSRQKPIEKDEPHQAGRAPSSSSKQLRATPSVELTNVFRSQRARGAVAALAARTPSLDSRAVQTDVLVPVIGSSAGGGRAAHFGRSESARRLVGREWSTPSDERENRSEFSVKSEPGAMRSLSGQSSSLEPCVETVADDQRPTTNGDIPSASAATPAPTQAPLPIIIDPTDTSGPSEPQLVVLPPSPAQQTATTPTAARRPDSLILSCSAAAAASNRSPVPMSAQSPVAMATKPAQIATIETATSPASRGPSPSVRSGGADRQHKFLYRSNSSRLYNRPRPKVQLSKEFDQIYFIGSNKEDEYYDSIDVIDERRSRSNFRRSASSSAAAGVAGGEGGVGVGATGFAATAAFCRSSTVIYNEYCGDEEATEAATTATTTTMMEAEVPNASAAAGLPKVATIGDVQAAVGSGAAIKGDAVTEPKALPVGNIVSPEPRKFGPHSAAAARSPKQSSMDEIEVMRDDGDDGKTATPAALAMVVLNLGDATGGVGIVASSGVGVAAAVDEAEESDSDGNGVGRNGRRVEAVVGGGRSGATPTTPTTITVRADIEDCGRRSE